jgi:hypothetical protein
MSICHVGTNVLQSKSLILAYPSVLLVSIESTSSRSPTKESEPSTVLPRLTILRTELTRRSAVLAEEAQG